MTYLAENLPMLLLVALVAVVILAPFFKSTTTSSTNAGQAPVYVVQIDPRQLQQKETKKKVAQPNSNWGRIFLAILFASLVLAAIAYQSKYEPKQERFVPVDTWEVDESDERIVRP